MVRLLGDGEHLEGAVATMPDGRRWGPFVNSTAAREWEALLGPRCMKLATARDVFEGTVCGDGYSLVSPFAVEFGMHPFEEVYDVLVHDDNGMVVFDRNAGLKAVAGDAPVMVDLPVAGKRYRRLPEPRPAPRVADVQAAVAAVASTQHGEVVVARDGSDYLVCWRLDRRRTRALPVLSLHTVEECALRAARTAARCHDPGPRRRSSKPRDYQREKVYLWEHSFPSDRSRFGGLEEAREFAREVCEALGIPVPDVSLGRTTLENHSYFSMLRGIVLQKGMLDSHTVIHELAHYVASLEWRAGEPSHGPRFAGILVGMLARFASADLTDALDRAEAAGIDIDREAAERLAAGGPPPRLR